jgi:hypothetical protein
MSRESKIGVTAVLAVVAVRIGIGNFVVNEWENIGVFLGNALGAVVEGLILGGVFFGLLVRRAARSSARRLAVAAFATSVLAVLSLVIPYSAPQAIVGAAAVALGLRARALAESGDGSGRLATVGLAVGLLVVAIWVVFIAVTIATAEYPVEYSG